MDDKLSFAGSFSTDRPVDKTFYDYINAFAKTFHVRRDPSILKKDAKWEEHAFRSLGDPTLGTEDAAFYVGHDDTSITYYIACKSTPSKQCNWVMTDLSTIEWNGRRDNSNYFAWLEFLIHNFFKPCGYHLNGSIHFTNGDDSSDFGCIICQDNQLRISSKISSLPPLSLYTDLELEREMEIRKQRRRRAS